MEGLTNAYGTRVQSLMVGAIQEGDLDRLLERIRDDGVGPAGLDGLRHALPGSVTRIPEIDFTLRWLREYAMAPISPRLAGTGFRHGFLPCSTAEYEFDRYGVDAYVSDFARTHYGWEVNSAGSIFMDDKWAFRELFEERGLDGYLPRCFGRIESGTFEGAAASLDDLVRDRGTVVVKGRNGGGGNHVHFCGLDGDTVLVDGEPCPGDPVASHFSDRAYLVEEFCRSGSYIRSIFPDAVSAVRAITANPREGDPFVMHLTHKVGTSETAPMDTFGKGSISVHVDDRGRFRDGVRYQDGRLVPATTHPDTGVDIPGTAIPDWETHRRELLDILAVLPEFRYVGWDLLVRDDGSLTVLEANTNPGVEVQYHEPLVTSDRVRSFFRESEFPWNARPFDHRPPGLGG